MNNKVLDPSKLEIPKYYGSHAKCIIKFRKSHEWRKAKILGSTWVYMRYRFLIEPDPKSQHFPEGGVFELSLDNRWNDATIIDVRLVPDEMWDWKVPKPEFTERELLVKRLRERIDSGEKIHDSSRASEAKDWKIVQVGNDSKYGCIAYSPSLDIMRKQTFDEFYGGGIVD